MTEVVAPGLLRAALVVLAAFGAVFWRRRRRGAVLADAVHRGTIAAMLAAVLYIALELVLYELGIPLPGSTRSGDA